MLLVLRHLRRPLTSATLAAAVAALFLLFYGSASPLRIGNKLGAGRASRSQHIVWELGDFGVRSYMFAGSTLDGQPVIIRAWLKAARRGGDGGGVQLRAVLCGEPLSGAFLEGAEAEQPCVQWPACYFPAEALGPGFLRMVGWHSRRVHQFAHRGNRTAAAISQGAPLVMHLELNATEASTQLFQLRLEGWRKFLAVDVADLLSTASETRDNRAKPAGPRGAWTAALRARRTASPMRFRVVSTRLLPSRASGDGATTVNETAVAAALVRRARHHAALGADSVWQFAGHEWRRRLSDVPDVAALLSGGGLRWASDDVGIPRVADPRCSAANDTAPQQTQPLQQIAASDADVIAGPVLEAVAQLQHWDGDRSCTLAAILTGDDCLRLDGSNSGGDFTREAAGCFSRDRTSVALLPAAASDASESMQAVAHMVLLGCGAAGASGSMPPVGGSYSNCAVHVPACAQAA